MGLFLIAVVFQCLHTERIAHFTYLTVLRQIKTITRQLESKNRSLFMVDNCSKSELLFKDLKNKRDETTNLSEVELSKPNE